jgi:hypothetical protein
MAMYLAEDSRLPTPTFTLLPLQMAAMQSWLRAVAEAESRGEAKEAEAKTRGGRAAAGGGGRIGAVSILLNGGRTVATRMMQEFRSGCAADLLGP